MSKSKVKCKTEGLDTREVEIFLSIVEANAFDEFVEEVFVIGDEACFDILSDDAAE